MTFPSGMVFRRSHLRYNYLGFATPTHSPTQISGVGKASVSPILERKMIKYLNKHKELIPLLFFTSLGMFGAFGYLAKLALLNPDVSWDRKNNQHPWLHVQPGQRVKLFGHRDLSTVIDHKHARPEEVKYL